MFVFGGGTATGVHLFCRRNFPNHTQLSFLCIKQVVLEDGHKVCQNPHCQILLKYILLTLIQLSDPPFEAGESGAHSSPTFLFNAQANINQFPASCQMVYHPVSQRQSQNHQGCVPACALAKDAYVQLLGIQRQARVSAGSLYHALLTSKPRYQSSLSSICLPLFHRRLLLYRQRAHHP